MKLTILCLTLAFAFSSVSGTAVSAQDEPAPEPVSEQPAVENPAPSPEPSAPVAETPPPVQEPSPVVESSPQPVSEPAPAPNVEARPDQSPVSTEAAPPRRPADPPSADGSERGSRPARSERSGDDSAPRETPAAGRTDFDPTGTGQSGRSGRGTDRTPDGPPPRSDDRRDDGRRDDNRRDDGRRDRDQRAQLGISIGPGGVQVFRGNPGFGPGQPHPLRNSYYGWDRRRGYAPPWYQGRGWGLSIDTRPQVYVPSSPVIVTQPQVVPPTAPEQPDEPPVPTDEQLSGMPGIELRGLVLYAVDRLNEELDGLSTGSGWKSFLKTDELKRIVPPPAQAPLPPNPGESSASEMEPILPESARSRLAVILKSFERVQQNDDYRQISQLWGFQTTYVALRELLVPPVERLRKQLVLSIELLDEELQQFETHAQWASHLKLDAARRVASIEPGAMSPADRQQIQTVVSIFDTVAAESSYRMISDLLGFRLTQSGARAYAAQLKVPAPPAPLANP